MSDNYEHIPTDLVTVKDASEILTANGDKITPEGLRKYCGRHDLIEQKLGRSLLVNPQRLAAYRDNFTREVMRGEHLKAKADASKPKRRQKRKSKSAQPSIANPAANSPATVDSLDRARTAKADREEAQADKARLALHKETRDLVSTAEFETLLGLLMTLLKESFFGVNLSDDTDAIIAVNDLPDARKKPTMNILKKRRRDTIAAFAKLAEDEMAKLDPDHSSGYPERFKNLISEIQAIRQTEFAATLNGTSTGVGAA